jgi:hypothetical protein
VAGTYHSLFFPQTVSKKKGTALDCAGTSLALTQNEYTSKREHTHTHLHKTSQEGPMDDECDDALWTMMAATRAYDAKPFVVREA